MQKRREIDAANVILCLLVMLIHILSGAVSALDRTGMQFAAVFIPSRLASFVVQGFIFLSALKYFMKLEGFDYKKFLISRLKTIVLPYVLWNVIYYFALMRIGYFVFDIKELIKYILIGNMISHFYFVVVIVQFYLLMPFWIALVKNIDWKFLVPISLIGMVVFGQYIGVSFRYNDRVFLKYFFYWICGCYAGFNYDRVTQKVKEYRKGIIVLFAFLALTDGILTWINASGRAEIAGLENIHIVYCITAILFVFTVLLWKSGKSVEKGISGIISRQSYNIYLSHCLILYYADWFNQWHIGLTPLGLLLFRALCCYGGTLVLWGAYDCIKRLRNA